MLERHNPQPHLFRSRIPSYLDLLTGTFMVRQLQPWFENISKRQVKSPKVYLRHSGIPHCLLDLPDEHALFGHPRMGASWEGVAIEQILRSLSPSQAYFWATHRGAELDLLLMHKGNRLGFEIKFNEAPQITKSMKVALSDLSLEHIWVVYPGSEIYPVDPQITVVPLSRTDEVLKSQSDG